MSEDGLRFTFRTYLKGKLPAILLAAVTEAFVAIALSVLGTSSGGVAAICLGILVMLIVYLVCDWMRRRRFMNELIDTASAIDRPEHATSFIERPDFLEGRIAYDAICAVSSSASAEITDLKESLAANKEYVDTWTHEIKTPLSAATLVANKMRGADAETLKRELERAEKLVEQALYASRADSLANDYLIREMRLADVVSEACKSNMHYLTSLGVAIEIAIDPALVVYADKSWLGFIITQIITNSAKYGAKTISLSAWQANEESSKASTVLEIRDDGCGIPAQDVPRVFERGFTGEVGRAHGSATGMGLFLAARMCAGMGLGLLIGSEVGVGTRVEISFPHDRRRAALEAANLTSM